MNWILGSKPKKKAAPSTDSNAENSLFVQSDIRDVVNPLAWDKLPEFVRQSCPNWKDEDLSRSYSEGVDSPPPSEDLLEGTVFSPPGEGGAEERTPHVLPAAALPRGCVKYVVCKGDTLVSVASKFDMTPSEVRGINKLGFLNTVLTDQVLCVYDPSKHRHRHRQRESKSIEALALEQHSPDKMDDKMDDDKVASTAASEQPPAEDVAQGQANSQPTLPFDEFEDELNASHIKVKVKYLTKDQGCVKGFLLLTPQSLTFTPFAQDPLVLEHSAGPYERIIFLENVIFAAVLSQAELMEVPLPISPYWLEMEEKLSSLQPPHPLPGRPVRYTGSPTEGGAVNSSEGGVVESSEVGVFESSEGGVVRSSEEDVFESSEGGVVRSSEEDVFESSEGGMVESSGVMESSEGGVIKSSEVMESSEGSVVKSSEGGVFNSPSDKDVVGDISEGGVAPCPPHTGDLSLEGGVVSVGFSKGDVPAVECDGASLEPRAVVFPQSQAGSSEPSLSGPRAPHPCPPPVPEDRAHSQALGSGLPKYLRIKVASDPHHTFSSAPSTGVAIPGSPRKLRDEFWFAIPNSRVEYVIPYFLHNHPKVNLGSIRQWIDGCFVMIDVDRDNALSVNSHHFGSEQWEVLSLQDISRPVIAKMLTTDLPLPVLEDPSRLVGTELLQKLSGNLMALAVGLPWKLAYSTFRDGFSLQTLYRKTALFEESPCVLVVRETEESVFGAALPCSLKRSEGFYGTGESFLFRFSRSVGFQIFNWTGRNHFFVRGDRTCLMIGGGDGRCGLWIDEGILNGSSAYCDTFGNEILSSSPEFVVTGLEVWSLG